jgi:predicted permease
VQGAPFTVVGVGPQGFKGFGLLVEPDVTVPLTANPAIFRGYNVNVNAGNVLWMKMAGRLQSGVTLEEARAQLESVWPAIKADVIPPTHAGAQRDNFLAIRLNVQSLATGQELYLRPKFTRPLYFLLGIAIVVLLIACVNLASLMLARVTGQAHDLALRTALGASRWRAARPILTEGILMALVGAALGVLLAYAASSAVGRVMLPSAPLPISLSTSPDLRVLGWTAFVAITTGLLTALVPAWVGASRDPRYFLQQHQRLLSASTRLGKLLIASQVALSVVLLINAGLFVRSWQYILGIDPGFSRNDAIVASFQTRPEANQLPDLQTYYPALMDGLRTVPGVERASITQLPLATTGLRQLVSPMTADPTDGVQAVFNAVSPGFFDSLDVDIIDGRDFAWTDRVSHVRVAIISRALAERLFPASSAIGQRIRIGAQPYRQNLEVIGVTHDARLYDVKDSLSFSVYITALQNPERMGGGNLIIRGSGVDQTALKRAVESLGSDYVTSIRTLPDLIGVALVQDQLTAAIAGFFGILALLLSALGIGGLVASGVAQRAKEIAIRIALGATRRRIVSSVLGQGVVVTVYGAGVGLLAGVGAARSMRTLFVGIGPNDPAVLIAVPTLLLLVAVVACILPAYRAATIDASAGLRTE